MPLFLFCPPATSLFMIRTGLIFQGRFSMIDDYIEEACFYLSEENVGKNEIARAFNLTEGQVESAISSYKAKIEEGRANYEGETRDFWLKNYRESSGDERITLVDDKGRFYHGWKSELEKLSSEKIIELLVINKQYSEKHPLSEFTKGEAVIGYDPLVPLRNIRRTVSLLEELLQKKEDAADDGEGEEEKTKKKNKKQ
jgi:arsenate reductase-like glutaredoxin family protein